MGKLDFAVSQHAGPKPKHIKHRQRHHSNDNSNDDPSTLYLKVQLDICDGNDPRPDGFAVGGHDYR